MNLNLYVWKANEPFLAKEDNPTRLINELLLDRYGYSEPTRLKDAEPAVRKPTSLHNPTNGFVSNQPTEDQLFSIVVESNGIVVAKNLTKAQAEVRLAEINTDGDMRIIPQ